MDTSLLLAASWLILLLGLLHSALGMWMFRRQFSDAAHAGWLGQFAEHADRRVAFWFTLFGPLLAMVGHVALHALTLNDWTQLRLIGGYLLLISILGVMALPKSPFWCGLFVAPMFLTSSHLV
jgi:Family of unknown function (DUF6463)